MSAKFTSLHLPKYDPFDPQVMCDPYPTYARLRASGPICRGGPGEWVVTHHAAVSALLKDPRLGNRFSAEQRQFMFGETQLGPFFERIVLNVPPPRHTRLRKLMGLALSPTRMRVLGESIAATTDELLSPIYDRGSFDAVRDVAIPLPVRVVCSLIGIPHSDLEIVHPRAALLCKAFGMRLPESERQKVNDALLWLRDYINAMARERARRLTEDLLSTMLGAMSGEDALTQDEVIDNVVFLFFAGFETTKNLISTAFAALTTHPRQFDRLRRDADLLPAAITELLRYDTPIQVAGRVALEPLEVGGHLIRRDRVVTLLLGAANHDETVFRRPEELDVSRSPNPYVSFGGGVHYCLGALLARLEATAVLEHLARRVAVLEAEAPPVRLLNPTFRGYSNVLVRLSMA